VLPGLVGGTSVASWCLATRASGLDPGDSGTVLATTRDGGLVLNGSTGPVEAAGQADWLLVSAHADHGPVQALVPRDTAGVTVHPAHSLDLVRRFAKVSFEEVGVGADALVGPPGSAADDIERQLETAVVLQCAEMAGAVGRVFDMTVEYAFDRYSFGRPLASYQALKHRFADLKLWLEAAYATSDAAAHAVDSGSASAAELVSVAKASIGERAPGMVQECVQLHGGIGTTWDHDIHLYLRRVVVDRSQLGAPSDHRERVADAMGL
jgi:alkylation response protein AidB-like acyl-CoA dehydrogenase